MGTTVVTEDIHSVPLRAARSIPSARPTPTMARMRKASEPPALERTHPDAQEDFR